MPGTLRPPVATGTLPFSLSTKFAESHTVRADVNEYHDGSSQRAPLVTSGRRNWKLSKRLTAAELITLRAFWEANPASAFYFYSPFETNPLFARNPTGTEGRYLVRFVSDWEQTTSMVRSDAGVELLEVAADGDFTGGIVTGGATTPATVATAWLSASTSWGIQPSGYTGYPVVSYVTGSTSGGVIDNTTGLTDTVSLAASIADLSTLSVIVTMGGTVFYDATAPGGTFTLDSLSLAVTFADGTSSTVTPNTAYVVSPETGSAGVSDILNPGIGATIERWHVSGLTTPKYMVLTGFTLPS